MKKPKFVMVTAQKIISKDVNQGIYFIWNAQVFVAGSRNKKFFHCQSDLQYQSATIAFRRGCEVFKKLGYTIIEDFMPKEKRIN
jgi:hypothetical protein